MVIDSEAKPLPVMPMFPRDERSGTFVMLMRPRVTLRKQDSVSGAACEMEARSANVLLKEL